eukprot:1140474-Pelagomonas_calceolata.AAC.2
MFHMDCVSSDRLSVIPITQRFQAANLWYFSGSVRIFLGGGDARRLSPRCFYYPQASYEDVFQLLQKQTN